MCRERDFFFFSGNVLKNKKSEKGAACDKQVAASVSQRSVSNNTTMVADESQHHFCPIELQERQEIPSSKQKKSPSVEWQPSVVVFCSSRLFVSVVESTLALFITLNQNLFVLLSGRAFWSVIPPHGHPTFKEMCWHPPGTRSWNFLFSAHPGNSVPCSRLSGCAVLEARMLFFPPSSTRLIVVELLFYFFLNLCNKPSSKVETRTPIWKVCTATPFHLQCTETPF